MCCNLTRVPAIFFFPAAIFILTANSLVHGDLNCSVAGFLKA
jgi:hypothetical protein